MVVLNRVNFQRLNTDWFRLFFCKLWIGLVVVQFLTTPLRAANWYVDNSLSSSANNGMAWASAWTNFSSIQWGSIGAGDVVNISGGTTNQIYRMSMTVGASGTSGNNIIIQGATDSGHNGTAIIDGSDVISSNWTLCASAAEAGGNTNYAHIYHTKLGSYWYPNAVGQFSGFTTNYGPVLFNPWQGTNPLAMCQLPKPYSPLSKTIYETFLMMYSQTNWTGATTTTLTDYRLPSLMGTNATTGFLWMSSVPPNQPAVQRINAFSGSKITFDEDSPVANALFAIANVLQTTLTQPGEFYLNPQPDANGLYDLFVWPYGDEDISTTHSVVSAIRPVSGGLIEIPSSSNPTLTKNYITIQNLTLRFSYGSMINRGNNADGTNIMLNNCDLYGAVKWSGQCVALPNVKNLTIENCKIHDSRGFMGGAVIGGDNVCNITYRSNFMARISDHGVNIGPSSNILVSANTFNSMLGQHKNSIFFNGSHAIDKSLGLTGILCERNYWTNCVWAWNMTEMWGTNTWRNNVAIGVLNTSVNQNSGNLFGTLQFFNNTFLVPNSTFGTITHDSLDTHGLAYGPSPLTNVTVVLVNNILDGASPDTPRTTRSHNVYVGLFQTTGGYVYQDKNSTWSGNNGGAGGKYVWGTGEVVDSNWAEVFNNATADVHIKAGSVAAGAGANLSASFTNDFTGASRPVSGAWDIGAYQGTNAAIINLLSPPSNFHRISTE